MDNGVYGLTKGQSSPTSDMGKITTSTPYGKIEVPVSPLNYYMTVGVSYIASYYSSKPKILANFIKDAMNHKGFSIVHVQSPCTTYNDTYELLKRKPREGIPGLAWEIPEEHDPSSENSAFDLLQRPGIPLGLVYKAEGKTLEDRQEEIREKVKEKDINETISQYVI